METETNTDSKGISEGFYKRPKTVHAKIRNTYFLYEATVFVDIIQMAQVTPVTSCRRYCNQ